jgi:ParB family chromosome partitioning protein
MARNVTSKFGVTDGLDFTSEQGITSIAIDKLIPYHNHRFTLYEGERLEDMIQSIKKNGVITPIIVRTANGGKYEILSGHNRVYAAGQAGLESVPAVIKVNLSDEDSEIFVVETNLIQRGFSDLKISEQAFAVALRYNKLFDERKRKEICDELYFIENGKHRPEDVPVENVPVEHHTTRDATAEEYGISSATVARLLRIDKLINEFKVLVDRGNIKVRSAVDLSYLTEEQQRNVYKVMTEKEVTVIDMKMAKQLREIASSYAVVTDELITDVLNGEYGSDEKPKDRGEKITLPTATYTRYLSIYSKKEANEIIEKALALYFEQGE